MKLAGLLTVFALIVPVSARADVLNPPGGPVYDAADGQTQLPERAPPQQRQRRPDGGGPQDRAQQRAHRQQVRQAIVRQFDVNGDGRLGPRERRRAIRILRRIENRLAAGGPQQGQGMRPGQMRRFIKRYDVNGDGNVGPREMPPGAADRLRRFDRNGDGWIEPGELGQ